MAARKINSVPLDVFEVFHPMSHTAGTHTGISIDKMKSAAELFFYMWNSITAHW
jgi:hypothetical protein